MPFRVILAGPLFFFSVWQCEKCGVGLQYVLWSYYFLVFIAVGCAIPVFVIVRELDAGIGIAGVTFLFMPVLFWLLWFPARFGVIDTTKG